MNGQTPISEEFLSLLDTACDGALVESQVEELTAELESDPAFRKAFIDHVRLRTNIRFLCRAERARDSAFGLIQAATGALPSGSRFPTVSLLGNTVRGTVDYFSSSWLTAYLVATVVLGIGILVGALIHVSQPVQVAIQSVPLPSPLSPLPSAVGQITGMIDCQWADPATAPVGPVAVPLGRKYALASGLMEITYDTGAKVILQGPATYEVESSAGGYLSLGRLTARLEKGSGVRGQGSEETHLKSEIRNQKSEISGPRPLTPGPFAIRTPTATVTDLGTEFGVEVDGQGNTTSQVYRGKVRLEASSAVRQGKGVAQVLRENQVARVTIGRTDRIEMLEPSLAPLNLVRRLPRPSLKVLDLADVVAGGDGFSGNRGRGIDPSTGRPTNVFPTARFLGGGNKYHRVEGLPFIDGVFIADGGPGPVQVTSTGVAFDYFSGTSAWGFGLIFAGGRVVYPYNEPEPWQVGSVKVVYPNSGPLPTDIGGVDYASAGHCLIFLHANNGITFDLDAVRKANPGWKLLRFLAVAGNSEMASTVQGDLPCWADFWVLVDGKARFQRRQITRQHGEFQIAISFDDKDRFLTLVSTDGGNTYLNDMIIFGDPRLELLSTEPNRGSEPRPK